MLRFSDSPLLGSYSGLGVGCKERVGRVPSLTFSDERLGWLFWFAAWLFCIFFPWDALDTPHFSPTNLLYINTYGF
jgi:hypothetical protein